MGVKKGLIDNKAINAPKGSDKPYIIPSLLLTISKVTITIVKCNHILAICTALARIQVAEVFVITHVYNLPAQMSTEHVARICRCIYMDARQNLGPAHV